MQRELTLRHYYTSSFRFCQLFLQHLLHQFLRHILYNFTEITSPQISLLSIFLSPNVRFAIPENANIWEFEPPPRIFLFTTIALSLPISYSCSSISRLLIPQLIISLLLFITIAQSLLLTLKTSTIYPIPHPPFPFVLYCIIYYSIAYLSCYYCLFLVLFGVIPSYSAIIFLLAQCNYFFCVFFERVIAQYSKSKKIGAGGHKNAPTTTATNDNTQITPKNSPNFNVISLAG